MSKIGALVGNVLHHYDASLFGWTAPFLAPINLASKRFFSRLHFFRSTI
jgi:hypothetical protein